MQKNLVEIESDPNELKKAEDVIITHFNQFISYIFDSTYALLGYKKNKLPIPTIKYSYVDGAIVWSLDEEFLDPKINTIVMNILDIFVEKYRGNREKMEYKKVVFWINGLDEIEKIPNHLVEVIRNAINQDILVISIITSELKDTTIRKAFDYAFVTGNIEKFYSMFNLKYTKQPLDSIVVNFGIRSKGFDIPFKMYKSNLEEIQALNFIDQLLND